MPYDPFDDATEPVADLASAEPKLGKTARADVPLAPKDLTTEPAKDANSDFSQELGILLLWNAPDDPAGATVTGYTISRRVKPADGAWGEWDDAWASISADDLLRTYFTDIDEPEEGEERAYRVLATSARGNSAWSEMAYAPTMRGMHMPATTELGTPSLPRPRAVMVGGIKTISILWDSGEGEERQIVQLLTEDRMFVDSQTVMPDVESADFDNDGAGIAPGTYRVQIVALGIGTDFRNSGTVLVTVE